MDDHGSTTPTDGPAGGSAHHDWEALKARRAAMAQGPALRDLGAAMSCPCSCHPRPAEMDHHQGGADCPCQWDDDERADRRQAARDLRDAIAHEQAGILRELAAGLDRRAQELGVTARVELWGAPFVVAGRCDGHSFYLRERHGDYEVAVSAMPGDQDLWSAHGGADSPHELVVASGDEGGIFDTGDPDGDPAAALSVAVTAVRRHLDAACDHAARGTWPFCPSCGQRAPSQSR